MLTKYTRYHEVDLKSVLNVYQQSIGVDYLNSEHAFFEDLRLFFACNSACLAIWEYGEAPVAAVRSEPYRDGYLISCLETTPEHRRKGCACALLSALMAEDPGVYYAHVDKRNKASLALHKKLGFTVFLDHAVHVDGSVFTNSFTLKK